MISRCTSTVPKDDVVSPRLLYSNSRCSQVSHWGSQVFPAFFSGVTNRSSELSNLLSALLDWSSALPGIASVPRLVADAPRCSQMHPKFSPSLRGVLKLITITLMVLLYHSSEIPVILNTSWNALLGSDTLLKLMHLSLHSTSSQTLLEVSID